LRSQGRGEKPFGRGYPLESAVANL
jgi:hypothetical protein